ncbi:glycosyltransferase [Herbiconiux sp. CPCC 205763]|uniref:Glycosyltransferase n=1 Tax=Herbiconiux aconitum TaxID=2970913 RepID=A0ABT2GRF1_9MICO|nr:glycosyltransferase [Herbiconiux aconitum]MCS5718763.1 glycosyltransferase [Herbiconiux aconitum]
MSERRRAVADGRPSGELPLEVTIVIPVKNDAARLRTCLEAIRRQTVAPDEVIVVDNASTDDSASWATACADPTGPNGRVSGGRQPPGADG